MTDAAPELVEADRHTDAASRRRGLGRWAVVLLAALLLVAVAAVAFSVDRLSTLGDADPSQTSAEAGFARDMQVHHQQGVELALIVRDATDDESVRLLAYDIATTQSQQSGQMYGWLAEWGLPQLGSDPAMTWMADSSDDQTGGHDGMQMSESSDPADASTDAAGSLMPGMATPAQIDELRSLEGVEAERMFLELMIAHHMGAVEMAEAVLERSQEPVVVALAESIVASQQSEIELMEGMLAERS